MARKINDDELLFAAAASAAGAAAAAAAESVGLPMLWRGGVSRMGVPFGTRVAMAVAIQGSRLIR